MKLMQWTEMIEIAVKSQGQWAVHVSNTLDLDDPDQRAAFDFCIERIKMIYPGNTKSAPLTTFCADGTLFFDTEQEARTYFNIFNTHPAYSSAVYAMLISADGAIIDENT